MFSECYIFNWLYTGTYKCNPGFIYYEHSDVTGYSEHNPHQCGLIIYADAQESAARGSRIGSCCINVPARSMHDYKVSAEEELKLLRLLGMRVWNMKKKVASLQQQLKSK